MYTEKGKVYFEWEDFEIAVAESDALIKIEQSIGNNVHLVAPYRGGLPLGVRMSNQCKIPLSILDYQRLDGDSKTVSMMKNAGINDDDVIYLIDDIADEGITINKCLEFLTTEFPHNRIEVYTIFGNANIHNPSWRYSFRHDGDWVQFIPFEGK